MPKNDSVQKTWRRTTTPSCRQSKLFNDGIENQPQSSGKSVGKHGGTVTRAAGAPHCSHRLATRFFNQIPRCGSNGQCCEQGHKGQSFKGSLDVTKLGKHRQ